MSKLKIAVVSNGEIKHYPYIKTRIESYDYIICADGGAHHVYNMGLTPDLIVGDFDSVPNEVLAHFKKLKVEVRDFPPEKDLTDTHLAIDMALEKKPTYIGLFGATGNRMDHTLSNINHLLYIKQNHVEGILIDDYNEIFLANNEKTTIKGNQGDIVSFISISQKTEGITLEGFKYPLNDRTLHQGDSLCVSNVMAGSTAILYKTTGDLLVIKSRDE